MAIEVARSPWRREYIARVPPQPGHCHPVKCRSGHGGKIVCVYGSRPAKNA
jgi:hypothetical protein